MNYINNYATINNAAWSRLLNVISLYRPLRTLFYMRKHLHTCMWIFQINAMHILYLKAKWTLCPIWVTNCLIISSGGAIAFALSFWCQTILMIFYTVCSKMYIDTWNGEYAIYKVINNIREYSVTITILSLLQVHYKSVFGYYYYFITSTLTTRHRLLVPCIIHYKVSLLTYKATNGESPRYISNVITAYPEGEH